MRNTLLLTSLACLAGCTTASSYEVHYDRAEVQYVTAPAGAAEQGDADRAQAVEASAGDEDVAEKLAVPASAHRPQSR